MNISWHGKTCVKIGAVSKKNGPINILIDPLDKESGLKGPKEVADIFLFTKTGRKIKQSEGFLINGPGEYEIKEVFIRGLEASPEKTIYSFEVEEINFCHLGLFDKDELASSQIEEIGDVDILFIPVGGNDALDAKQAVKIMGQLEPKITIPINYKIPVLPKLDELKKFLDLLGIKSAESAPKLSIKKKNIEENSKIVVLEI